MNIHARKQSVAEHALKTISPKFLELILFPTEKCNFRCTYCYEDFKLGRMSDEVITNIKSLISERLPLLTHLKLSWFGGEPLLAYDIVQDLTGYAHDLCLDQHKTFFADMTTNGFLLDTDRLRWLVNHNVRTFQISLDGLSDDHNKTRKLGNGRGTFDRIWSNLDQASKTDIPFKFILRLHITKQNIDAIEEVHAEIDRKFGDDARFSVFLKAIEDLGGGEEARSAVPDAAGVRSLQQRFDALASHSVLLEDSYICYAARPNSFVIRSDGAVGKCTVALKSNTNNLGRLVEGGKMNIDVAKLRRWMSGYESLEQSELTCPAFALKLW
ncbi:radical SAM protein [Rhizobium leguminosarum]|uniref:radical SAM protein n=1 Tax=Rhizobium leguminosarum TaxID=384 RepID=UPI000685A3C2|nr:radical SAM protein [Rhizobium leguminosarum]